jgi:hypothetical protein
LAGPETLLIENISETENVLLKSFYILEKLLVGGHLPIDMLNLSLLSELLPSLAHALQPSAKHSRILASANTLAFLVNFLAAAGGPLLANDGEAEDTFLQHLFAVVMSTLYAYVPEYKQTFPTLPTAVTLPPDVLKSLETLVSVIPALFRLRLAVRQSVASYPPELPHVVHLLIHLMKSLPSLTGTAAVVGNIVQDYSPKLNPETRHPLEREVCSVAEQLLLTLEAKATVEVDSLAMSRLQALAGTVFKITFSSVGPGTEFKASRLDWACVSIAQRLFQHPQWACSKIACDELLVTLLSSPLSDEHLLFHLGTSLPHVLRLLVSPPNISVGQIALQFVISCLSAVTKTAFQTQLLQVALPIMLSRLPFDSTAMGHVMALGGRFPDVFKAQMGTLDNELKTILQNAAVAQQQQAAAAKEQEQRRKQKGEEEKSRKKKKKKGRRGEKVTGIDFGNF